MALELVTLTAEPVHAPLLEAFYAGIYRAAFERQREPLEVWRSALRGELPYRQTIRLALDGGEIAGGIAYEHYPRSGCGLVTYMVVAPHARRAGLGKRLQGDAAAELYAAGAPLVLGEVDDPRPLRGEAADVAWARIERNQRWGARVLDARYVQPALGPGLQRDRGLVLIRLADLAAPPGDAIDGTVVRAFVTELYDATEGGPPDEETAIADRVPLVALVRSEW